MRQNCLADLKPAQLLFFHPTDGIPGIDFDTVCKLHGIIIPVNRFHGKSILIYGKPSRLFIEVKTDARLFPYFFHAQSRLPIKLKNSHRCRPTHMNAFQIDITVRCRRCRRFHLCNAFYCNFLNQMHAVCLHRVKPVNHIINAVFLMGSRIP